MRFEILGPPRVVHEGKEFTLSARKSEVLLAALLIKANQVVPSESLVRELWETPPRRAADGLYVYISQLRKFLVPFGNGHDPITTRSPGYSLRLEQGDLDLHDFERLVLIGRQHLDRQEAEAAIPAFETALTLCRDSGGGVMTGGPIVNCFVVWLEEARLECLELLMTALLMAGRHREAINPLYSLIAEQPLHEAFYELLMLALYRSNRRADALRVYQQARNLIIDEIGLEPGRGMRDLHQAILAGDSTLDARVPNWTLV